MAAMIVSSLVSAASVARAAGGSAWLDSSSVAPFEERIAVAASADRTTVWTSVRFSSNPGSVGFVFVVPPGASLDASTDAFFEALEVATAPRVFPPAGVDPYCPGESGTPNVFSIEGDTGHVASAEASAIVLEDEPSVATWASENGFALSTELADDLASTSGVRFLAVAVDATQSSTQTPTIRVVMPGALPALPLALTRAPSSDLRVTAWFFGGGRAEVSGSDEVDVPSVHIQWQAPTSSSSYAEARAKALKPFASDGAIVEASSHALFAHDLGIANGTATIESVVHTYFERAAAYDSAVPGFAKCEASANEIMDETSLVASACPRAALGVVDGEGDASCVDGTDGIAPSMLRCGPADDLAVALSGLAPASAWITRATFVIPANEAGHDFSVDFTSAAPVSPILTAGHVDVSECGAEGTSGVGVGVSVGSGYGSGSGYGDQNGGGGAGGGSDAASDVGDAVDDATDAASDSGSCDCSGNTGTGSDGSDSSGCDGSGSDDSSSSCSGDSSGSSGCDGGGDSGGCSGGDEDCSVTREKRHGVRASVVLMAFLAFAAPLRRRARPSAKSIKRVA